MPTVDVEDNIKKLRESLERTTQDLFRMQGMLSTFEGFKKGGLKTIDLPNDPNQPVEPTEELESIQEKPE
jgi:lipid II:glycine glycyltransferase (peptidoglycan interpeptide bridge formation enzyme)